VSPLYSMIDLESIRQCLNYALEFEASSTTATQSNVPEKNSNKMHLTNCGYSRRERDTSWQIRYKPFGPIHTGVLAGSDDSSTARVLTSVAVAHFESNGNKMIPKNLVLFSLKCAELRHLLENGRDGLLRKKGTVVERIPALSRMGGGTPVDLGPLLLPLLGSNAPVPVNVAQLIDMAVACTYPDHFEGIVCGEWKIRPHKKGTNLIKFMQTPISFEAVSYLIRDCLQPDLYDFSSPSNGRVRLKIPVIPCPTRQGPRKRRKLTDNERLELVDQTSATRATPKRSFQHQQESLIKKQQRTKESKGTATKRSTRQRKSVRPFDATPWTLTQKTRMMEESRQGKKASNASKNAMKRGQVEATEQRGELANPTAHGMRVGTVPGTQASTLRKRQEESLQARQPTRSSARIRSKSKVEYKIKASEEDKIDQSTIRRAQSTHPILQTRKAPTARRVPTSTRKVAFIDGAEAVFLEKENEGSNVEHDDHWLMLDFHGIVSDYKYHDFDPVDFGFTIETATEAIQKQLDAIQEKSLNSADDEIYSAETKMYARSMQERRQKSDSERIEKERNREDYERRLMEYQYYGAKKRSAYDIEMEAFSERSVHFANRRESCRSLACPNGPNCDVCSPPDGNTGSSQFSKIGCEIFSPSIRPSDVRDRWRLSTADTDPELIVKGKNKAFGSRRSGRNFNKWQHSFYMLSEMKHSLRFIINYNNGYLKQDE